MICFIKCVLVSFVSFGLTVWVQLQQQQQLQLPAGPVLYEQKQRLSNCFYSTKYSIIGHDSAVTL